MRANNIPVKIFWLQDGEEIHVGPLHDKKVQGKPCRVPIDKLMVLPRQ